MSVVAKIPPQKKTFLPNLPPSLLLFQKTFHLPWVPVSSGMWMCWDELAGVMDYHKRLSLWSSTIFSCYVNHDGNNWHFCANLSLGVLPVWNRDLAHIGNVQKSSSLATLSWLWSRVLDSSYQPLRHWWSHASGKQASVNTCWLLRDNGRVSSRKEDSGAVLSSSSEKASRSRKLQSEQKNDQHVDWCRSRLRYMNERSLL